MLALLLKRETIIIKTVMYIWTKFILLKLSVREWYCAYEMKKKTYRAGEIFAYIDYDESKPMRYGQTFRSAVIQLYESKPMRCSRDMNKWAHM